MTTRDQQIEARLLSACCQHYTTMHGMPKCCRAGMNYHEVAGPPTFGSFLRLPCITTSMTDRPNVRPCPKYLAETREQIAADVDAFEKVIAALDRDVSACCEAPFTIRGEKRWCSKCGSFVGFFCSPKEHDHDFED